MSTTKEKRPVVYRDIKELIPYASNAKNHDETQVAELAASIREFGWTRPVLIDEKNTIRAGHGCVLAARKLGLQKVPCIVLAGLSEAQLKAYTIADNRLSEKAAWNWELLAAELEGLNDLEGFAMELTGFDLDDLKDVKKKAGKARDEREQGQEGEDDFGTVPMAPITRPGDVWHIGPHRLVCGDSLDNETLDALLAGVQAHLILTDPPYAIYGSATGIASDITDDKMVRPFFEKVLGIGAQRLPWFGHLYVCCDWRSWPAIWESAKRVPSIEPKNLLMWDKGGAGLGSNYANTYELIGFFSKLPKQTAMGHRPAGQRPIHKPNVLRYNRPTGKEREHNAAKPVGLMRELIENSSGPEDLVLEPFCGSGSTMVAADQTGRVCYAVDIAPGWCDITIGRMQRLRDYQARLGENGPTFQEIAQERAGDKKNQEVTPPPARKKSAKAKQRVHH